MFEVEHASPRVGSVIRTTKEDMVAGTYADQINELLRERSALVFPKVDLTIEEQLKFAGTIGKVFLVGGKDVQKISLDPEVNPVADYTRGAFYWHIDGANDDVPAKATMLYAKELPPAGGDTMFSSLYLAYDTLSEGMKRMLAGLRTYNDGENKQRYGGKSRAEWYGTAGMGGKLHAVQDNPVVAEHPLIRTHPETGRKALFIGDQSRRFVDMTDEESKPLIAYLMAHATRPEFVYRHQWRAHDILAWDNRCTMHQALGDFDETQLRHLERTTVLGTPSGHVGAEA